MLPGCLGACLPPSFSCPAGFGGQRRLLRRRAAARSAAFDRPQEAIGASTDESAAARRATFTASCPGLSHGALPGRCDVRLIAAFVSATSCHAHSLRSALDRPVSRPAPVRAGEGQGRARVCATARCAGRHESASRRECPSSRRRRHRCRRLPCPAGPATASRRRSSACRRGRRRHGLRCQGAGVGRQGGQAAQGLLVLRRQQVRGCGRHV